MQQQNTPKKMNVWDSLQAQEESMYETRDGQINNRLIVAWSAGWI